MQPNGPLRGANRVSVHQETSLGRFSSVSVPQATADGRYVLLCPLGAGAAAQVFEAIDSRSGQRVALKVLKKQHTEAAMGQDEEMSCASTAEFAVYKALGAAAGAADDRDAPAAAAAGIACAYEHGGQRVRACAHMLVLVSLHACSSMQLHAAPCSSMQGSCKPHAQNHPPVLPFHLIRRPDPWHSKPPPPTPFYVPPAAGA